MTEDIPPPPEPLVSREVLLCLGDVFISAQKELAVRLRQHLNAAGVHAGFAEKNGNGAGVVIGDAAATTPKGKQFGIYATVTGNRAAMASAQAQLDRWEENITRAPASVESVVARL